MTETDSKLLLGLGRTMIPIPGALWQRLVARQAQHTAAGLGFMSADHHRLRDLVVVELPRQGAPLSPTWIAQRLDLPPARVSALLDELEQRLTFLFRNPRGEVTWAYPVTVEPTPHRVTFGTGEQVYAAWAIDAIATPFVQGQLRAEPLSFMIRTECAHSARPLTLEIDSGLACRVVDPGAAPVLSIPLVDFDKLDDPSIIDAF